MEFQYAALSPMEVVVPRGGAAGFPKDPKRRLRIVLGGTLAAAMCAAALLLFAGDPKGAPPPEALAMDKAMLAAAGAPALHAVHGARIQQLVGTDSYRLTGPDTEESHCGRVEVMHDGVWGSICDDA
jgi:hypothetical protein